MRRAVEWDLDSYSTDERRDWNHVVPESQGTWRKEPGSAYYMSIALE